MNILIYRWKSYTQFDMMETLALRGHVVDDIMGEMTNYEEDPDFERRFADRLDANHYDLVLTSNYFPLISDACEKRGIRYLAWCCDSPISTMYHESIFNKCNTVLQFDKLNQIEFEQMGAPVYYLPLAGAVDRLDRTMEACPDGYLHDISFIGSMYNKTSYDEIYEHMTDYQKGYFDAVLKMQMNAYGIYLLDEALDAQTMADFSRNFNLASSDRSFASLRMTVATTALSFKIAQMERQTAIAKISEKFDMDVYTDDDSVNFVRAKNHGTVDYWSEAPVVFRRSKINLNLTLKSIQSGIPQRVWDIMAAGGFCLTNYQPELLLYFENGVDLVFFEDLNDLRNKIAYYLTHDEEREQIARNGYEKVKQLHQYNNRFDAMREWIPEI